MNPIPSETEGLPLFEGLATNNPAVHAERREQAIQSVDTHSDSAWKHAAMEAVRQVCMTHEWFTTDEVWAVLDRQGWDRPATPATMGPIMRWAATNGLVENTNTFRESKQITNHRKVTVWRSL